MSEVMKVVSLVMKLRGLHVLDDDRVFPLFCSRVNLGVVAMFT